MVTGRLTRLGYRSGETVAGRQGLIDADVGPLARPPFSGAIERRTAYAWAVSVAERHHIVTQALAFSPLLAVTLTAIILANRVQDMETLGYFGVLMINAVSSGTFILPVPGLAVVVVAVAVWNPVLVALAGATGSTLGELTGYLAGAGSHTMVSRALARRRSYLRIEAWVRRRGALTIFILAAIPNPLFDLAGFASGSMGYPIQRFVLACWAGKMLKFLLVALAGYWGMPGLLGLFNL